MSDHRGAALLLPSLPNAWQLLGDKGYDGKGKPLPGHEVNLRKRDKVGARKPGDMVLCDDTALLARANAVLQGEKPGHK